MLFAKYTGEKYQEHESGFRYSYEAHYDFKRRGLRIKQLNGYYKDNSAFYPDSSIHTCSSRFHPILFCQLRERTVYAYLVKHCNWPRALTSLVLDHLQTTDAGIYWKLVEVETQYLAPIDCFL